MFTDRLRQILQGDGAAPQPAPGEKAPRPAPNLWRSMDPVQRKSSGLEQFFYAIQGTQGLRLLDLSGASQANISFITSLGHRLYSEDLLSSLDSCFGESEFFENQKDPHRVDAFLEQSLRRVEGPVHGALIWDSLQFLTSPLVELVVDQIHRLLEPGSLMLAYFHAEERARLVPTAHYRIHDARTLTLVPRGQRPPAHYFNNRSLERLFERFDSVKFFLTRDHLREVIVRR